MPKTQVWLPDDTKPKKQKKQQKQKKSKKQSKHMANDFWDKLIQSDQTTALCFTDDTTVQAKILGRDVYNIMIEVDGKQHMILKHSIKWVDEV